MRCFCCNTLCKLRFSLSRSLSIRVFLGVFLFSCSDHELQVHICHMEWNAKKTNRTPFVYSALVSVRKKSCLSLSKQKTFQEIVSHSYFSFALLLVSRSFSLSPPYHLSPCQVRVPCAVYCWCCCVYTFCTFSNSQSENLTFSVYVIFLRTITIFGPYMSTSNQHSCPFSNVRRPRRRHHFYFTCECETGERTEHDRYMNGINAQLSSMVTQQNHKLNIASANWNRFCVDSCSMRHVRFVCICVWTCVPSKCNNLLIYVDFSGLLHNLFFVVNVDSCQLLSSTV